MRQNGYPLCRALPTQNCPCGAHLGQVGHDVSNHARLKEGEGERKDS